MKAWSGAALLMVLAAGACAPKRGLTPIPPEAMRSFQLVPLPKSISSTGETVAIERELQVALPSGASPELSAATATWLNELKSTYPATARGEAFKIDLLRAAEGGPEAYSLKVAKSGVTISAADDAGLFYALQTLRQLLDATAARMLPIVEIDDAPRFSYRGMHLDVVRHFFPVAFVKKYIDQMARYKLNTFHWHLTDDQGWRLQIAKYPRLTEVGGCRKETMVAKNFSPYVGDGTPVCGFYTQAEAREVVQYARERFITVIPEIEMPGHATAAVAAYQIGRRRVGKEWR